MHDAVEIQKERDPKSHDRNTKLIYRFNTPLYDINQRAEFHSKFYNGIIPHQIDHDNFTYKHNLLERFIERGPIQKELHAIQHSFRNTTHLDFYTDGSVIDIGKMSMSMSLAFYQNRYATPEAKFKATLERFPSLTKAETAAVLAALLTTPENCKVNIFTDSKVTMDHYAHNYSSTRLFFKEENNIIWAMIREIIKENNLTVNFHKVKAHSGNYANDEAD